MVSKRIKKALSIVLATMLIFSGILPTYVEAVYASEGAEEPNGIEVEMEGTEVETTEEKEEAIPLDQGEIEEEEVSEEIPEIIPEEEPLEESPQNEPLEVEEEIEAEHSEDASSEMENEDSKPEEEMPEDVIREESTPAIEEKEEEKTNEEVTPQEEGEKDEEEVTPEEPKEDSEEKDVEETPSEEPKDKEEANDEPTEEPNEDASVFSYVPIYRVFESEKNSILGYPLSESAVLTSGFGTRTPITLPNGNVSSENHNGIDLAISFGTPVLASEDGVVTASEYRSGWGICIFIDHGNGLETRYGHLSEVNVKEGDIVSRGQQIGKVGSTGDSTGPHLHFEVLENGTSVDPEPYLTETLFPEIDFSSKRLLVKGEEKDLKDEPVIATLGEIVLIQYESVEEVKEAYLRLIKTFSFVEVDSVMGIAEGEVEGEPTEYMTESDNPFTEAEEAPVDKIRYDVAVIDTGANNADKIVSVIGDDGKDINGHGQLMIDIINAVSPEAKILSIKAIGDNGVGDVSAVYAAIKLAIEENVKVINLSISMIATDDTFAVEEVINEAIEKGIVVIGAAGNNGIDAKYTIPGKIDKAYIAGSSDAEGSALYISNIGDTVDFYIYSTATSIAAAKASGYFIKNGSFDGVEEYFLQEDLTFSIEIEQEMKFIKENADQSMIDTSDLNFLGLVHSIITFAEEDVDSIDELWSNEESSIEKFLGFTRKYVLLYRGTDSSEYVIAKVADVNLLKGLTFKEYLTARDNNDGEVITGCIYDENTGLLYVPKSLVTFSSEEHQLNEVRVQLLYSGTLNNIQENRFLTQANTTTMTRFTNTPAKFSKKPTVGSYVKLSATTTYDTYAYSGPVYWYNSGDTGYNSTGNMSYQIVNGVIDGNIPYSIYQLDPDVSYAEWKVVVSEADYTLSDGTVVHLPGGTFYLICNHVGLDADYNYYDDVYNPPPGANPFVPFQQAYLRILEVHEDTEEIVCALVTPSSHTQSGAGIFKMPYEYDEDGYLYLKKSSANPSITTGNSCYSLKGATYEIYDNASLSGTPVATLVVEDEEGNTNTVQLPAGTYYYKETVAGKGYKLKTYDASTDKIEVTTANTEDNPAVINTTDDPDDDPGRFRLHKVKDDQDHGLITDSSAVFKVQFFPNDSWTDVPGENGTKTWYYKTINGRIMLQNEDYLDTSRTNSPRFENNGTSPVFPLGTVLVTEEKAPEGYLETDLELKGKISLNSQGEAEFTWVTGEVNKKLFYEEETPSIINRTIMGGAKFLKIDAPRNENIPEGDATLKDAEITIKNAETNEVVKVIKTDANGNATTGNRDLPYGSYYAVETKASTGYLLNEDWRVEFSITEDGVIVDKTDSDSALTQEPIRGGIKLIKSDKETVVAQGDADFSGIQFKIKNVSGEKVVVNGTKFNDGADVWTMTTNAAGFATTSNNLLPYGTYTVREVATNGKYLLTDGTPKTFEIRQNGVIVDKDKSNNKIEFKDEVVKGGVKFKKIDAERDEAVPQGQATLKGAEITIYNASKEKVLVKGEEFDSGKPITNLILKTDANGNATTGNRDLPYGSYYAVETKASTGYLLNEDWRVEFSITEDGVIVDKTDSDSALTQEIIRADISFFKVDIDGNKMANIPFLISLLDEDGNKVEGESHVVVTDENGRLDTSLLPKTGDKVNSLDEYAVNGVFTDDSKLDSTVGVWFGEQSAREEGKGALIYGNYLIEELSCEGNMGYDLLEATMIVDNSTLPVVFTNGKTFILDNILINLDILPKSDLIDVASETKTVSFLSEAKVTDTVTWHHLKITRTYKLKTEIYYEDKEGAVTKLGENNVTFKPERPQGVLTDTVNGITKNTVTVNTSNLKGGKLHAVDYIYVVRDGEDILIASHNREMTEENQMLGVPYVGTIASDGKTNSHVGTVEVDAEISDIVKYENFPDRGSFIVEATFRFADTGEEIGKVRTLLNTDKRLTSVTVDEDGTINGPLSGEFKMPTFTFDASDLGGRTVVVTEVFFDKVTKEKFIEHYDLTDEDQSIHYLKIGTQARDSEIGTHTGRVTSEGAVIDRVKVENVVKDAEYLIKGKFVRKDTLEVLAEAETTFIGKLTGGTEIVELTFTGIDSTVLEGLSAVAFEYAFVNDVEVAEHEDPEDEDQIINYPKVRTTALDGKTSTHTASVGETSIDDFVELGNLTVGETYRLTANLMKPDGKEYIYSKGDEETFFTQSKEFVATSRDMTISMSWLLPEEVTYDLEGMTLTVFEVLDVLGTITETTIDPETGTAKSSLTYEFITVAGHEDISDKNQMIHFPGGRTYAKDKKSGTKEIFASEEAAVIDEFHHKNLNIGEKYQIVAELYSLTKKETVSAVTLDYTPKTKDGMVEIEFSFNAKERMGEHLIVIETVRSNDVPVIIHRELDDTEQMVYIPKIGTVALDKTDSDKYLAAGKGQVIEDALSYEGLEPNKPHFAILTIYDKTEGRLIEGVEIRKDFISSESGSGSVIIDATLDLTGKEGHVLVAYEKVFSEENPDEPVGEHENPEDEDQTLYVPRIGTVALDKADEDKFIASEENQVIVDTITYEGLKPNTKHFAILTIYDKTEGKLLEGIKVRKAFTSSDTGIGTVDVEVTVNGKELSGHVLVMYEEIYDELIPEKPIAEHKNPDDIDQTIGVPEIRTIIKNREDGANLIVPYWTNDVTDIVYFKGLIPGLEYEIEGVFVSKLDGKETEIKGTATFTPEESEGEVEVPFSFDGTAYQGAAYVAYETLKYNDTPIAEHKDIEDEDQTIEVKPIGKIEVDKASVPPIPGTPGPYPRTGDSSNITNWIILFIVSLFFMVIYGVKIRRRKVRP